MPDGWAVLRPDGRFIDIFADKATADYVARNQQRVERGTVRVRPMVFADAEPPKTVREGRDFDVTFGEPKGET